MRIFQLNFDKMVIFFLLSLKSQNFYLFVNFINGGVTQKEEKGNFTENSYIFQYLYLLNYHYKCYSVNFLSYGGYTSNSHNELNTCISRGKTIKTITNRKRESQLPTITGINTSTVMCDLFGIASSQNFFNVL